MADEVRKLAERTSTEQINALVDNVHQAADGTIATMKAVTGATRAGFATQQSTPPSSCLCAWPTWPRRSPNHTTMPSRPTR